MQQGVEEVGNSHNSTINNNNNMWIRLILLVYYQLSQLVRSSVNQIPSKPKFYFSGFLQGHERCPGIAVKDEPRTFWHVPRKTAGSRMFILRQRWPKGHLCVGSPWKDTATAALTKWRPWKHQWNVFQSGFGQHRYSSLSFKIKNETESELYHDFLFNLKLPGSLYEHLQCHWWCWVSSFFFFQSAYKEAINGRNSFTPEIRLRA